LICFNQDEQGAVFPNDDSPLELQDRQCIVMNWTADTYKKYYNRENLAASFTQNHSSMDRNENAVAKKITLEDCMDLFLKEEKLSKEDSWYCSKCKEHVQAYKRFCAYSIVLFNCD
jgi:ubiquitin C-terminal hydrolase